MAQVGENAKIFDPEGEVAVRTRALIDTDKCVKGKCPHAIPLLPSEMANERGTSSPFQPARNLLLAHAILSPDL